MTDIYLATLTLLAFAIVYVFRIQVATVAAWVCAISALVVLSVPGAIIIGAIIIAIAI